VRVARKEIKLKWIKLHAINNALLARHEVCAHAKLYTKQSGEQRRERKKVELACANEEEKDFVPRNPRTTLRTT
jgi:hypothetical protein